MMMPAACTSNAGNARYDQRKLNERVAESTTALGIDPKNARAFCDRARVWNEQGITTTQWKDCKGRVTERSQNLPWPTPTEGLLGSEKGAGQGY